MIVHAGRSPGAQLPPKDDPEATEQRKIKDQRRAEGADERQRILLAQKGAIEREGEQDGIKRVLPARMVDG